MPSWWFVGSIKFVAPVILAGFFAVNMYELVKVRGAYSGMPIWAIVVGGWSVTFIVFFSGVVAKIYENSRAKKGIADTEVNEWK